jgi:alpha-L-arabinofuranosidase
MGWIDWNDNVLEHMAGKIDYLSVHRYATEALGSDSEVKFTGNCINYSVGAHPLTQLLIPLK